MVQRASTAGSGPCATSRSGSSVPLRTPVSGFDHALQRFAPRGIGPDPTMTLAVGDLAPNFTLPSSGGQSVTLSDLTAGSAVVVFFYPKDDTPGCTVEACGFRDRYDAFTEAGAVVV